ncbi:MAG TPA: hypothetical protein VHR45_18595 [Thermoanaerobaculia bacterium]|nr:hypothetical protein [Thermoanaerobaculia bacterium]
MSNEQVTSLIGFGVGKDGELHLVMAEEIWKVLRGVAISGQSPPVERGYVRVHVTRKVTGLDFTAVPAHQDPPCPPFTWPV